MAFLDLEDDALYRLELFLGEIYDEADAYVIQPYGKQRQRHASTGSRGLTVQ
jgi:hypothetical protein